MTAVLDQASFERVGHGQPREECACGGWIEAVTRLKPDVERAIRDHQRTERHQAWRAKLGL